MKLFLLVKNINIKTLVSGDKQARITLETLYPDDVAALAFWADKQEISVTFDELKKTK